MQEEKLQAEVRPVMHINIIFASNKFFNNIVNHNSSYNTSHSLIYKYWFSGGYVLHPLPQVVGIQEMWENKTLSVVQTPLDQYSFALASEDHFSARKPLDKMTTFAISFSQPSLPTFDYLCTIDNGDEVQLLLEDNITQLKVVLSSPHLGSLRSRAETLLTTLRQLQELISLIGECQQKVTV